MNILKWNHQKVQTFSPLEIGFFIIGRVLVGFGMGALAMRFFPSLSDWLIFLPLVFGALFLIFATKGLFRKSGSH